MVPVPAAPPRLLMAESSLQQSGPPSSGLGPV